MSGAYNPRLITERDAEAALVAHYKQQESDAMVRTAMGEQHVADHLGAIDAAVNTALEPMFAELSDHLPAITAVCVCGGGAPVRRGAPANACHSSETSMSPARLNSMSRPASRSPAGEPSFAAGSLIQGTASSLRPLQGAESPSHCTQSVTSCQPSATIAGRCIAVPSPPMPLRPAAGLSRVPALARNGATCMARPQGSPALPLAYVVSQREDCGEAMRLRFSPGQ